MKRLFILLTALILTAVLTSALAASGLQVTSHPKDCTVDEGGNCTFTASAKNKTGITWCFFHPATGQDITATEAARLFPQLGIKGKNTNNLYLSSVPAELDGWQVYCVYNRETEKVFTDKAWLFVNPAGGVSAAKGDPAVLSAAAATPAPADGGASGGDEDGPAADVPATVPDGEITVTAVGAKLKQLNEKGRATGASGTSLTFADGAAYFTVEASGRPEYWVLNGVRYDFNKKVRKIRIMGLHESLTLEAVPAGRQPETLAAAGMARTGESCVITTKNASMCHFDENGKGAGGWFKEFDFTQDYQNRATGAAESGGQVTFRVKAADTSANRISFWYFNDSKWYFGSDVNSFDVRTLDRSMFYKPVFKAVSPTKKPTEPPRDATGQYKVIIN